MNINYEVLRKNTVNSSEPPHITEQWQSVIQQCENKRLGELERARLALNSVDYVTSNDLPFRLLITRSPQCIEKLSKEQKIHKQHCIINGRHGGAVYTLSSPKNIEIPRAFVYHNTYSIKRIQDGKISAGYNEYANFHDALSAGCYVTALDGILFFGKKRIAADINVLKRQSTDIDVVMERVMVMDSFTGNTRKMACYHYASPKK